MQYIICRSFWIRWRYKNSNEKTYVYVGLCNDPRTNIILKTSGFKKMKKVFRISISTSKEDTGQWQFASGSIIYYLVVRLFTISCSVTTLPPCSCMQLFSLLYGSELDMGNDQCKMQCHPPVFVCLYMF